MQQLASISAIRCDGHTRFELLVRILIVGIVSAILLERMLYYQEQAERTVMETTVIHIRSGMRLHIADLITQQRDSETGAMLEENPVRWLERPPDSYLGVLASLSTHDIPRGSWFFDKQRGELVYVPKLTRYFSGAEGKEEVRFKVLAKSISSNKENSQVQKVEGVDIVPVKPYKWF